jgi:Ca-activated chloride channel homolog
MNLENYTFEYPYAFLILILFFACLKFCKTKGISFYFPNIKLLEQASKKSILLINSLKILTILFLVIALSSPVKEDTLIINDDKGYEISLILDASGSMQEANKFGIVKDIVTDFVNKREHDRLGLSIFADFAYVAIPLTYDKDSIKRLLTKVDVGIAGRQSTALNEALFLSSNLFKTSNSKNKIAILLTDGMDNANTIPLDVAIKTAKKYGIKVYTIGVGTPGDFNPAVLQEIASQTGAKYFYADTIQGLKDIYSTINTLEKSEIKADKYVKKTYLFQYSLTFALLFFIAYFYVANKE